LDSAVHRGERRGVPPVNGDFGAFRGKHASDRCTNPAGASRDECDSIS
jgi:hypothetical protein